MASLTVYAFETYRDLMDNKSDQRVMNWFLMSSPFPTICITFAYLMFVTKIGPKLMENRKPFKLNNILIFYNGCQMITSTFLFYQACFTAGWLTDLQWFCQLPDYSMNPRAYAVASGSWYFYISKIVELLDTVFFVLRKKNNQITSLHLIHHSSVPFFCWIGVKFLAGGSLSFFAFLNSFIHLLMYGYYFLSALGPHMQKYLWWKKYLTMMQIVQFVLIIGHAVAHLYIKDCEIPYIYSYILISITGTVLILFMHFYRMEYQVRAKLLQENKVHKRKQKQKKGSAIN